MRARGSAEGEIRKARRLCSGRESATYTCVATFNIYESYEIYCLYDVAVQRARSSENSY